MEMTFFQASNPTGGNKKDNTHNKIPVAMCNNLWAQLTKDLNLIFIHSLNISNLKTLNTRKGEVKDKNSQEMMGCQYCSLK